MKTIDYLYGGFFVISLVFIYFALKEYNKSKYLILEGVKTKGKVIDLIRKSSDDGYTYTPVFEYKDKLNNTITFKSSVSSKPASYRVGDVVHIVYSKKTDDRKIISFWGLYRWTIILLSIAAPLLIIGGGYLLYSRG